MILNNEELNELSIIESQVLSVKKNIQMPLIDLITILIEEIEKEDKDESIKENKVFLAIKNLLECHDQISQANNLITDFFENIVND